MLKIFWTSLEITGRNLLTTVIKPTDSIALWVWHPRYVTWCAIIGRNLSTHNFYYSKSNSSDMFRLHKAAIVKPYVTENVKWKLYSCSHTYGYKIHGATFYDHMYGYSCLFFFLHFLTHTSWWWLFRATATCNCFAFTTMKVVCQRTAL
jgi:hypothetical protein